MPEKTETPAITEEESNAEKVLAQVTQQTVQTSHTLALHIKQHDDVETIAQEKANAIIVKVTQDLNEAYQAALTEASEQMQKEISEAQSRMEEERREFQATYDSKITKALKALQEERAKEWTQYELLCSNTSDTLKAALDTSIKANNENTQKAMESTQLELNQAHKAQTDEAVETVNAKSETLKKFVIGATVAAATLAIAISGIIATLI